MASKEAAVAYLEQFRDLVTRGEAEERLYSTAFVLAPVILELIALIIAVGGVIAAFLSSSEKTAFSAVVTGTGAAILIDIIAIILWIYVFYKLIDRENKHWRRIKLLYDTLVNILRSIGVEEHKLVAVKSVVDDIKVRLSERSAVLWAVLSAIIPFLGFYVLHFLTRDVYEHGSHEVRLLENLKPLLGEKGVTLTQTFTALYDRNTILYIILSIITLGLFTIYWVYRANADWNEHLTEHRRIEREILEGLERIVKTG